MTTWSSGMIFTTRLDPTDRELLTTGTTCSACQLNMTGYSVLGIEMMN